MAPARPDRQRLCVVHWNEGRLPEGRSRVYRAVIRWLIAARRKQREEQGFTDWFAQRALARLALAMVDSPTGKRAVFDLEDGALAIDALLEREFPQLTDEERRHRGRRWLRFECLGSGVVEEVAGNRMRFWHLTFQEFLAALQLAWCGDGDDRKKDWWPVVLKHLDDAQWRETIELFPGCLLDEGGEGRVDTLLDRVLSLAGKKDDLASEARVAGIVGRLLAPLSVYQYRPQPGVANSYRKALDRSMAIFTMNGAVKVPAETRIAAAEALGRGGDPRLRRNNFIEVPALGGSRLGKYPVTVEDYQRFVEHEGYDQREHWSYEGWSIKVENGWETPGMWLEQLEHPNRPVIYVSWYEAEAYCWWLSEQRGEAIRLPSEAEWATAATPEDGAYPWGEADADLEKANFARSLGSSPTPVGVYPAGDGIFSHCDIAGNVWEWCQDEEGLLDFKGLHRKEGDISRVLRGGAWSFPVECLRAASRSSFHASGRRDDIGFRVLAAPARR